jgi:hypothetical protein
MERRRPYYRPDGTDQRPLGTVMNALRVHIRIERSGHLTGSGLPWRTGPPSRDVRVTCSSGT